MDRIPYIASDEGNPIAKFSVTTQADGPRDQAVKASFVGIKCGCAPLGARAGPCRREDLTYVPRIGERTVAFQAIDREAASVRAILSVWITVEMWTTWG